MATSSSGKVTIYQYEVVLQRGLFFDENRGFSGNYFSKMAFEGILGRLQKCQRIPIFVKIHFYAPETLS
jgi:hypothetical protein